MGEICGSDNLIEGRSVTINPLIFNYRNTCNTIAPSGKDEVKRNIENIYLLLVLGWEVTARSEILQTAQEFADWLSINLTRLIGNHYHPDPYPDPDFDPNEWVSEFSLPRNYIQ